MNGMLLLADPTLAMIDAFCPIFEAADMEHTLLQIRALPSGERTEATAESVIAGSLPVGNRWGWKQALREIRELAEAER